MSGRLSMSDLSETIGCKSNQRSIMIRWLSKNGWKFEIDAKGYPIVMTAYRDRKLGVSDGKTQSKYEDAPNRQAFA